MAGRSPGLDPGLDPAIGYPHQIANDAIAVSNHPMEMAGPSPTMTWLDRCVWYVNNQGGWYDAADGEAMPGVSLKRRQSPSSGLSGWPPHRERGMIMFDILTIIS